MALKLSTQYDKRGFLGAKANRHWNQLRNPQQAQTDAQRLHRIEALAPEMEQRTQEAMQAKVAEWREAARKGDLELSSIIAEAFAMVREASRRTSGLFHYPEQLLGGLALVRGAVAEMATGEGKTLAVSLPAFTFALFGRGVHCVTVNTYLAQRDAEFTAPILEYLGLSVRCLPEGQAGTPQAKRAAYQADVTYGVGYEYGFDYLRDQLALLRSPQAGARERLRNALLGLPTPKPPVVQRELAFAIIDEVDSVLIDEAGSPLVISESPQGKNEGAVAYLTARDVARELKRDVHYEIELAKRSVKLTDEGFRSIHAYQDIPWDYLRRPWQNYILNALRADHFFIRDVSYVVDEEDKICIIDEFTGRRFSERTWRDGLHQAVEAKENVEIRAENDSAASITRQRYFGLYETICGLTGTAAESAGEFWHFFRMEVETVPLHKPSARTIIPERVFQTQAAMFQAVVEDAWGRAYHQQPVLIGTRTIRASEAIAEILHANEVPFQLLTAKQDKEENEIVAHAGEAGRILLATNMAGRGTHIDLDEAAEAAGGLHVIAVERNESIRIDRQLIGRGARQGEPGGAQVYVSAEDHLLVNYAPELVDKMLDANPNENGEISSRFSKAIDEVQQAVERQRYEQRLLMAQRDKWLDEIKTSLA